MNEVERNAKLEELIRAYDTLANTLQAMRFLWSFVGKKPRKRQRRRTTFGTFRRWLEEEHSAECELLRCDMGSEVGVARVGNVINLLNDRLKLADDMPIDALGRALSLNEDGALREIRDLKTMLGLP